MESSIPSLLVTLATHAAPRLLNRTFFKSTVVEKAIDKTEQQFRALNSGGGIKESIRAWLTAEEAARLVREINSGRAQVENAERLYELFQEKATIPGLEEAQARNILVTFIKELERAALQEEDALWLLDQRFQEHLDRHVRENLSSQLADIKEAVLERGANGDGIREGDERWHEKIDKANQLYEQGKAKSALEQYSHLLEQLGDKEVHPSIRYRLYTNKGACYLARQQFSSARKAFLKALDYDPEGALAHANLAQAALARGNHDEALDRAKQALKLEPESRIAAHVLAQVGGEDWEELVPNELKETPEVLTARGLVHAKHQQLDRAVELFSEALRRGNRSPQVLVMLAEVLYSRLLPDAPNFEEEAERIRRLADEAIGQLSDEQPQLLARAHVARGLSQFDAEDAIPDLEQARQLDPDSPGPTAALAKAYARSGELEGAIFCLRSIPEEQFSPAHEAQMANILGQQGDQQAARDHLRRAAKGADQFPDSNYFRLELAETAVAIGELGFAREQLEKIEVNVGDHRISVLRARIASREDDIERLVEHYEAAIAQAQGEQAAKIQLEAGVNLQSLGDYERALRFLLPAYESLQSKTAAQPVLQGLVKTGRFPKATEILAQVQAQAAEADAPLPDWALDIGSLIALSHDDVEEATQFLEQLIEREGQDTSTVGLRLARVLVQAGQGDQARQVLERHVATSDLDPRDKMFAAELHQRSDGNEDPITLAYEAIRDEPDDAELQLAYVKIFLEEEDTTRESLEADKVGEDTWVRLEDGQDDEKPEYFIVTDEPSSGSFGAPEYAPESDVAKKLIGLTTGDNVEFEFETYRVAEIKSCYVHVFQHILLRFNIQHPEVGALRKFKVGSPDSPRFFGPIIRQLQENKKTQERLLEFYEKRRLPLGAVAEALGEPFWRVYFHLAQASDVHLHVADGTSHWQARSRQSARQDGAIVVSYSALLTLQELGDLGILPELYAELVAPRSLLQGVTDHLNKLNEERAQGGGQRLALGEVGPSIIEYDAEDLTPLIETLEEMLDFLESSTMIETRPTKFTGREATRVREMVGSSSFDAYALSAEDRVLYADDFGLLSLAANEASVPGFSTYWLLLEAVEQGLIETHSLHDAATELIHLNHYFVPINAEMLLDVLSDDAYQFSKRYQEVLDRLRPHYANLQSSIPVAVEFFKKLATSPLGGGFLRQAVSQMLMRLTEGKEPLGVLERLEQLVIVHLHLLPTHQRVIREEIQKLREIRGGGRFAP